MVKKVLLFVASCCYVIGILAVPAPIHVPTLGEIRVHAVPYPYRPQIVQGIPDSFRLNDPLDSEKITYIFEVFSDGRYFLRDESPNGITRAEVGYKSYLNSISYDVSEGFYILKSFENKAVKISYVKDISGLRFLGTDWIETSEIESDIQKLYHKRKGDLDVVRL